MNGAADSAVLARRARRLLRWYPAAWRARYGEEFTELLIADLAELPRCWRRTADVARGGLRARLANAGLAAFPLDPEASRRASLAALTGSAATFLTVGAALWAQLAVSWQWAPPATSAVATAMVAMSAAMLLLTVLAFAAFVPVAWGTARAFAQGRGRRLRLPAALLTAGTAVLVAGGRHFGNGWPGTGGHWWPHQGLVPGGIAAFAWACTLSVSSYWAHPAALASFPVAELAWMLVSPAAACCVITGSVLLVRRVRWPATALRYEKILGVAAGMGMAAFLAGALCWVAAAPGPGILFRPGAIGEAGLGVMAVALAASGQALRRIWRVEPATAARR